MDKETLDQRLELLMSMREHEAIKIIKEHKLLNYVLKNEKCAKMYGLSQTDLNFLKEVVK